MGPNIQLQVIYESLWLILQNGRGGIMWENIVFFLMII